MVAASGGCGCGAGCGSGEGCGCGGTGASSSVADAAATNRTPRPARVLSSAVRPGPSKAAHQDGVCQSFDERVRSEERPIRRDGLPLRASHQSDGRSGLLLCPGALGTVDLGVPLAEVLCRVQPAADELIRAPRARRAADLDLGLGAGRERARWYSADDDGVAQLGYRTERFFVPWRWLSQYTHDLAATRAKEGGSTAPVGLVSSVDDALATLLPEYMAVRRSTGVSNTDLGRLLGCWNLPRTGNNSRYYFWHDGWGAPHRFLLNTCWLVIGYSGFIKDPTKYGSVPDGFGFLGEEWCRDLGPFVKRVLSGEAATDIAGERCWATLNIKGGESERETTMRCGAQSRSCGDGFNPGKCDGLGWDDWTRWFDGDDWMWRFDTVDALGAQAPEGSCAATMYAGGAAWPIVAQAGDLSALGMVADWVLYQARMALDFYRAGEGGPAYLAVGQRLARYALRLMAHWGGLLIHESGHLYLTGDHCPFGACMDIAREHWLWKVVGCLGLPVNAFAPRGTSDFPGEVYRGVHEASRSSDDDAQHTFEYRVYLESVGTVGARAEVCVERSYCEGGAGGLVEFDIEHCTVLTLEEDPGPTMTLEEGDDPPSAPDVAGDVKACVEWRDGWLVAVPCPEEHIPWEFEEPYDPS